MTDPDQSGTSADEAASQQENPAVQQETPAAQQETPAQDEAQSTEDGATETESTEVETQETATETPQSTEAGTTEVETQETATETPQSTEAGTTEVETQDTATETPQSTEAGTTEVETQDTATETPQSTEDADAGATEEQQDARSKPKKSKTGLLLGLVSGAFVLLLALVLVAFFAWPGYAGPGNPKSKADEAAAALASKDPGRLDQVSCHSEDGKSLAQISPQALNLVQSAKPAGGPQMILDTEAHAPVDLTLSAQGQTQTLPSTAILGVSHHEWCLKGLAQRQ